MIKDLLRPAVGGPVLEQASHEQNTLCFCSLFESDLGNTC